MRSPAGPTLRLVGYCRVSTEEQARDGISLVAQAERLRAYAVAHGAELVSMERDECSGKLAPARRPGLAAALSAVRGGEADGVLALKLDRLSRSTRDVLDLVDESGRDGWRLVSVSEQLDTGTAAGRLVVTVLAALAQMEREQVGERTRFALAAVAREGRARSRFTPFGWRTADGEAEVRAGDRRPLEQHGLEQALLKSMLRARQRGLGARRLARWLNERGRENVRTGKPWTPETVATVLRSHDRRVEAIGVA